MSIQLLSMDILHAMTHITLDKIHFKSYDYDPMIARMKHFLNIVYCNQWPQDVHSDTADWNQTLFFRFTNFFPTSYGFIVRGTLPEIAVNCSVSKWDISQLAFFSIKTSTQTVCGSTMFLINMPATDWHKYIPIMFLCLVSQYLRQ